MKSNKREWYLEYLDENSKKSFKHIGHWPQPHWTRRWTSAVYSFVDVQAKNLRERI